MISESVHVKLGISGTYWDKRPEYRIEAGDFVVQSHITAPSDTVEYFEFDYGYKGNNADLKIILLNKEDSDTIENADKTGIVSDMLLNIVRVEVDEIDITQLSLKVSKYHTDKPVNYLGKTTQDVANCMNLGWNGTWTLSWTNPFYVWLLENL